MAPLGARTALVLSLGLACLASASSVLAQPRCAPTPADMLGPFYTPNAPERARTGRGLVVSGRVMSASACMPIPGARLEWWSANSRGEYDDGHRATARTDAEGRYRYETDVPGRYEPRPIHVHVKVTAPGHRPLVTQVYPAPGPTLVETDFILVHE